VQQKPEEEVEERKIDSEEEGDTQRGTQTKSMSSLLFSQLRLICINPIAQLALCSIFGIYIHLHHDTRSGSRFLVGENK
jgi:flagellar biosynthesis protein FlhB